MKPAQIRTVLKTIGVVLLVVAIFFVAGETCLFPIPKDPELLPFTNLSGLRQCTRDPLEGWRLLPLFA